jgi:putative ABC transport system permease protein
MALGVSLVVTVLVIHQVIEYSFQRNAQGYDLVVGAKGGQLELVLNTVYYIGRPVENIPYTCFKEFLPGGHYETSVEKAIPICMGDNYEGFLVIGTVPERFTDLKYLDDRPYEFAQGRNFRSENFYEAVIGAQVANKTGLKVGDELKPTHGTGKGGHQHRPFKVVGVLAQTGTPVDRAAYVNIEGFYHLEGHSRHVKSGDADHDEHHGESEHDEHHDAKPVDAAVKHDAHDEHDEHDGHDEHLAPNQPAPESVRRVTAILVCVKPARLLSLAKLVNEAPLTQAALPVQVMTELLRGLIGNVQRLLLILAALVVVVAGIGILVSIYNSMNDRRRDIAIMRALGAQRWMVMAIILLESILLSLGGGAIGALLGHGLIGALAPSILEYTGVVVSPLQFTWPELVLIPSLVVLAAAVGYLPAAIAYRTDVAASLTNSQ